MNWIQVTYNNGTSFPIIREYELTYDDTGAIFPDTKWPDNTTGTYYTSALSSVQEYGKDGSKLPITKFAYADKMHLTSVDNGYNGKVELIYEGSDNNDAQNPFPTLGDSISSINPELDFDANNFGVPHTGANAALYKSGDEYIFWANWFQYKDDSDILNPGKMVLVEASVANTSGGSITMYASNYSQSHPWTATTGSNKVYTLFKVPMNISGLNTDGKFEFHFDNTGINLSGARVSMLPTRYRVSERRVYPNEDDSASCIPTNCISTTYSYTGGAFNDPTNTNISAANYITGSVVHPPFTELRGNATVTVTRPDGGYTKTTYNQGEATSNSDILAGNPTKVEVWKWDGTTHKQVSETDYIYDANTVVQIAPDSTGQPYRATCYANIHNPHNPCLDTLTAYFVGTPTVIEKTFNNDGTDYIAKKTETKIKLNAQSLPDYGLVEFTKISTGKEPNWTTYTSSYFTYTNLLGNTTFPNQYIIGLPEYSVTCDGDLASNYLGNPLIACGSAQSKYLSFSYNDYYNDNSTSVNKNGHLKNTYSLTNFINPNLTVTNDLNWTNLQMTATKSEYDAYGNVVKSYQGYKLGSAATQYPPSDGTASRITESCYNINTIAYPGTPNCVVTGTAVSNGYGIYPVWQKNPNGQFTYYYYDLTVGGLPNHEIDINGGETFINYDVYGRVQSVVKPGDTAGSPTLQFAYHDTDLATGHFWTEAWEKIDNTHDWVVRKYYDGLGALIQTQTFGSTLTGSAWTSGSVFSDASCGSGGCVSVVDQLTDYLAVNGITYKRSRQTAPYATAYQSGYITPTWSNVTDTLYDEQGRTLKITSPDQTFQSFSFSLDMSLGWQKTTATDPKTNVTETWSDVWNQVRKVRPAAGPMTQYSYDLAGHLTGVEQKNRDTGVTFTSTTMTYDVAGRKLTMNDPDMGAWSYAYDAYGNLISQTDAKNQRTCLYYDNLNRLNGKNYQTSATACPSTDPQNYAVTNTYDSNAGGNYGIGRRTMLTDSSGQTTWVYDVRGRVVSQSKLVLNAGVYTTAWTYNSADLQTSITYPGGNNGSLGETVTTGYSDLSAQSLTSNLTGSPTMVSSSNYDAAGRITSRVYGNGTPSLIEAFGYYSWSTKDGLLQTHMIGSLMNLSYAYDNDHNIENITNATTDPDQLQTFTYDALNRLTSASVNAVPIMNDPGYSDTVANSKNFLYDDFGRLTRGADGVTLNYNSNTPFHGVKNTGITYDANGNMIQRIGTDNKSYTLNYDTENRLTGASQNANQAPTSTFVYDGDGNRVLGTENKGTANEVTTVYIGNYYEAQLSQPQMVQNPGFENGSPTASNWNEQYYFGTTSISTSTQTNNGNRAYALSNQAYGVLLSDPITTGFTPGANYNLYAYLRGVIDPAESNGEWKIQANCYNSSNTLTAFVVDHSATLNSQAWQSHGGQFTIPPDTTKITVALYAYRISGWVAFDDVSLIIKDGSTNLLANYSFDSGSNWNSAPNWTKFDETNGKFPATGYTHMGVGISAPHSGSNAFAITNRAYGKIASDFIPVTANYLYNLSVYMRGVLDSNDPIGAILVRAEYWYYNGVSYASQGCNDYYPTNLDAVTWQSVGGQLTIPANANRVRISLYSTMSSGWVAFDDASLIHVGDTTNLILNGDFETFTGNTAAHWSYVDETQGGFPATTYWLYGSLTSAPHGGQSAVSISNLPDGWLNSDAITVIPGASYDLHAAVRGGIDVHASTGGWMLRAAFYTNGTYLSYVDVSNAAPLGAAYAWYGGSFNVPSGANQVRVQLYIFLAEGWVAFDDVRLAQVPGSVSSSTKYYYLGSQRVAQRTNGGALQYTFTDHLGSTVLTTDSNFGNAQELRYNAWGKLRYTSSGTVANNAYTYTGQRQETGIGLDFYNARWYDSYLNRFLSPDSIIPDPYNPLDYDRYSYVRNNPVNFNDPSGNMPTDGCNYEGCSATDADKGELAYSEARYYYQNCQSGYGGGCPDYKGMAVFAVTGLVGVSALPEVAAGEAVNEFTLTIASQCMSNPFCLYLLNLATGVESPNFGNQFSEQTGITTAEGTEVQLFRAGSDLTPSTADLKIVDGLVQTSRGVSLNQDISKLPTRFGAPFQVISIPDGLKIIQRGVDLGHYEIVPVNPMSLEKFKELLQQVVLK